MAHGRGEWRASRRGYPSVLRRMLPWGWQEHAAMFVTRVAEMHGSGPCAAPEADASSDAAGLVRSNLSESLLRSGPWGRPALWE